MNNNEPKDFALSVDSGSKLSLQSPTDIFPSITERCGNSWNIVSKRNHGGKTPRFFSQRRTWLRGSISDSGEKITKILEIKQIQMQNNNKIMRISNRELSLFSPDGEYGTSSFFCSGETFFQYKYH